LDVERLDAILKPKIIDINQTTMMYNRVGGAI